MYSGLNPFIDPLESKPKVAPGLAIQEVEGGFPHSEILGSKLVRSSPRLIAAYHVLHRLSAPRHPPNALVTLDHSHDRWPPLKQRSRPNTTIAPRTRRPGSDRKDLSLESLPKTFAYLMHPAHTPCGGRVAPQDQRSRNRPHA